MPDLPPALARLAAVVEAQPEPLRAAFRYGLALAMVEAGTARLVAAEAGDLVTFETAAGERFTLPNPGLSPADEEMMKQMIREILDRDNAA